MLACRAVNTIEPLGTMRLLTLKNVLAATDLEASSVAALESAKALADASGADLHVVHVSSRKDAAAGLERALEQVDIAPSRASVHLVAGDAASEIGRLADKLGADALVLGAHREGTGASKRQLGSTAMAIVTNAAVPCLVAKHALRLPLEHVAVAVDMSDAARGALAVGLSWASALRAVGVGEVAPTQLTTLHVRRSAQPPPDALEREIAHVRDEAGSWAGVSIEPAWLVGESVTDAIGRYTVEHHADLLVVGTRGLGVDSVGRVGSVSAALMNELDVPVLLVPPAVWTAQAPG